MTSTTVRARVQGKAYTALFEHATDDEYKPPATPELESYPKGISAVYVLEPGEALTMAHYLYRQARLVGDRGIAQACRMSADNIEGSLRKIDFDFTSVEEMQIIAARGRLRHAQAQFNRALLDAVDAGLPSTVIARAAHLSRSDWRVHPNPLK